MSLISRRVCHIIGITNERLNEFVGEIRSFLKEDKIPEQYVVNVYKDQVTCCGYFPIGVVVEIEGPKAPAIKDLDEKILGRIMEICGREKIQYHECSRLELLQDVNGTVFNQS